MASEDLPAHGPRGPANVSALDKAALRAVMRSARGRYVAGLSATERRALEAALAGHVRAWLAAEYPDGAAVAAYAAHGSEVDVAAAARGAALPWFADAMSDCVFKRGPATERGPFGVRQPRASAPVVTPQVILAPLIAFDRTGARLGQGGGHYDRLIAALPDRAAVRVIGCAWAMQEVAHVPGDPWDMALDGVVTPDGWAFGPGSPRVR